MKRKDILREIEAEIESIPQKIRAERLEEYRDVAKRVVDELPANERRRFFVRSAALAIMNLENWGGGGRDLLTPHIGSTFNRIV